MNCKEAQALFQNYIDGHLPEKILPDFLEHMEECPKCLEDLKVQYAIYTAISQLNSGKDFSDDYGSEVMRKLAGDREFLKRRHRRKLSLRFVSILLCVCAGITIGLSDTKSIVRVYLPDTEESHFSLNYYGIDKGRDPVYRAIKFYNEEVIRQLEGASDGGEQP